MPCINCNEETRYTHTTNNCKYKDKKCKKCGKTGHLIYKCQEESCKYCDEIIRHTHIYELCKFKDIVCNKCGNINLMDKSDVYENKSFACWDCKKIYVIEEIPSDIKSFLKYTASPDINQRPRIVRQ